MTNFADIEDQLIKEAQKQEEIMNSNFAKEAQKHEEIMDPNLACDLGETTEEISEIFSLINFFS